VMGTQCIEFLDPNQNSCTESLLITISAAIVNETTECVIDNSGSFHDNKRKLLSRVGDFTGLPNYTADTRGIQLHHSMYGDAEEDRRHPLARFFHFRYESKVAGRKSSRAP